MNLFDFDFPTERTIRATRAKRAGQFTALVVYDPQNRGGSFVENLLTAAGLRVEIEDEGEPVPNPQPIETDNNSDSE